LPGTLPTVYGTPLPSPVYPTQPGLSKERLDALRARRGPLFPLEWALGSPLSTLRRAREPSFLTREGIKSSNGIQSFPDFLRNEKLRNLDVFWESGNLKKDGILAGEKLNIN